MKNKLGQCLVVCGVLLLAGGCGNWGEMKEFSSAEGGFKVTMPGNPSQKTQTQQGLTAKFWQVQKGKDEAVVALIDMPIPGNLGEARMQEALDGAERGMFSQLPGGRVTGSKRITLGGAHPGRELDGEVPSKSIVVKARVYFVNRRLYQVIASGNATWVNSPDCQRFLDSFQLTQ